MTLRANGPLAGLQWLKRGFDTARRNPRAIFGGAAVLAVAWLLPNLVQLLLQAALRPGPLGTNAIAALTTLLAIALLAPLIGGYLRVIDASEHGRPALASDIFSAFRARQGSQRMVGFALLVMLLQLGLLSLLFGVFREGVEALAGWSTRVTELLSGATPGKPVQLPPPPEGLGGFLGLGSLGALFLSSVFAIGMGQVVFAGRRVGGALADGLLGTLRNLLPLLVLAVLAFALLMGIGLVAVVVVAVLSMIHPMLAALVFLPLYMLFLLAAYALMFGVMYQLWRDVAAERAPLPGGIEA